MTILEKRNEAIKFLDKLKKELLQPELVENEMIECSVNVTKDITVNERKLCNKRIEITLRYAEDIKIGYKQRNKEEINAPRN